MLVALKIQFKSLSKDKMVWISVLFPIIIAICIRLFTGNLVIEQSIGYVENNLSSEQIADLEQFAQLKQFENESDLETYILNSTNDGIGIIFNDEIGDYSFLLQGNELAINDYNLSALYDYLKHGSSFDKISIDVMTNDENYVMTLLITITVLMGLFLGAVFNAFNIVSEKEDNINILNQILPMSISTYVIQKSIIGFIASFVLSLITLLIVTGVGIPILPTVVLLLMGSLLSTFVGLYLGHYSNNQMVAIVMTKFVLLAFTFFPFIGFMIPKESEWVKNIFYVVPSYAVFNGLWAVVENQDVGVIMINSLITLFYTILAACIYWLISKRNKTLNSI